MRYYPDAYERIAQASLRAPAEQCLFLVPDILNIHDENAVMLHDGVQKLGHVARSEAPFIKKFLMDAAQEEGCDQVIVLSLPSIINDGALKWSSLLTARAAGVVHERVARKHARKFLKGK